MRLAGLQSASRVSLAHGRACITKVSYIIHTCLPMVSFNYPSKLWLSVRDMSTLCFFLQNPTAQAFEFCPVECHPPSTTSRGVVDTDIDNVNACTVSFCKHPRPHCATVMCVTFSPRSYFCLSCRQLPHSKMLLNWHISGW